MFKAISFKTMYTPSECNIIAEGEVCVHVIAFMIGWLIIAGYVSRKALCYGFGEKTCACTTLVQCNLFASTMSLNQVNPSLPDVKL